MHMSQFGPNHITFSTQLGHIPVGLVPTPSVSCDLLNRASMSRGSLPLNATWVDLEKTCCFHALYYGASYERASQEDGGWSDRWVFFAPLRQARFVYGRHLHPAAANGNINQWITAWQPGWC